VSRHVADPFPGRKFLVRCVNEYRLEHLGVFRKSVSLKACIEKLAAPHIPVMLIKLPQPAGIFPRGGANERAMLREARNCNLHAIAIKVHKTSAG